MTETSRMVTGASRLALPVLMALAMLLPLGAAPRAQAPASQARTIEGVCGVSVTIRVCATGAPLASFVSLVTFAQGGTILESPGSLAFAPGQRSNGHGVWAHDGGLSFTQKTVALILFDTAPPPPAPPTYAGWQTITQRVTLTGANHFESSGTSDFYRTGETEPYRSTCATAVGERFR